jgi:hypothetical protein
MVLVLITYLVLLRKEQQAEKNEKKESILDKNVYGEKLNFLDSHDLTVS